MFEKIHARNTDLNERLENIRARIEVITVSLVGPAERPGKSSGLGGDVAPASGHLNRLDHDTSELSRIVENVSDALNHLEAVLDLASHSLNRASLKGQY